MVTELEFLRMFEISLTSPAGVQGLVVSGCSFRSLCDNCNAASKHPDLNCWYHLVVMEEKSAIVICA